MTMFGSVLGACVLLAAPAAPPELNDQTYAKWRDHISPKPEEVSWEEIPWRSTLWDAVIEAREREKPILLWAMNGHPLACT
jgi:hypothetical protein